MQLILYRPFLAWARTQPGALKVLGDAAAKFDRADDLVYRWGQLRAIGDWSVKHLEPLMRQGESTDDVEALEAEILEAVNAPIETGAAVERETRDQAWLQRTHAALNVLASLLSVDTVNAAAEPAAAAKEEKPSQAPAPETVVPVPE